MDGDEDAGQNLGTHIVREFDGSRTRVEIGIWLNSGSQRKLAEEASGMVHVRVRCNRDPSAPDLLERVARRIVVGGAPPVGLQTPCWVWEGARDSRGNARVRAGGRTLYVRRVLMDAKSGPISPGDCVTSLCRNSACVAPHHHVVGTRADAQALGRKGCLYIGDLLCAQRLVSEGVSFKSVGSAWQLSESFLRDVIETLATRVAPDILSSAAQHGPAECLPRIT